ncbi:uncharacterized protein LOC125307638 [Alosa alosa]|uniref:uncharacterized protein LOC125307638 n=1 Tax=Alosa alosa TaxID=278164 RepID=UPI0020152131|nr:uncharacterized protein LOC125307638 [Alosa alosa]
MIINPAERRDAGTYRVQITEEATGKTVLESPLMHLLPPDLYSTPLPGQISERCCLCSKVWDEPPVLLPGRAIFDYVTQVLRCKGSSAIQDPVHQSLEAPVSDVDLSISCSANGERSVRCSSNGDSPQYSWSLDGRPLGEADADLSSDNQTLLLRGDVTGQLTCSVRNHVSSTHTTRLMELCSGLDSMCDATQDAACYGALGGPVYLQLIEDTRGCELKFYHENKRAFTFRKNKPVFHDEFNTPSVLQRWQFVPDNGTMIINPAESRDAGTYRVVITASSGTSVGQHTVQLTIEAPLSDVDLSISCSANGERSVRCSSNGDSPQFSWSLDGRPLGEADADVSSDNQTLLLRGDVTGQLTCSVRNHVSSTHTTPLLFGCSGGISPVFISVWLAEIIILTSLLVGGYYLYIRNRTSHTPGGGADAVTPHWSRGGAAPDYSFIPHPRISSINAGLDSMCDATQDAACYGALGGPVYLQLMRNTRGHKLSLYYNKRRDAGTYRVQITESTGRGVKHTVQLTIEAPVSSVDLSISSSANGERSVRCSSTGDSPQYSWSLDGRPLGEADADLSSDNQTILLRGDVTGQLTCSVRNHVSSTHTTRLMDLCSGGISPVFISVWLAEIIILTSLLVGGYYLYIRNRTSHTPDQDVELTLTSTSRRRTPEEVQMQ